VTSQHLLNSALLVAVLTLVVKVAGALKELVVAYGFGTAPELGAFVFSAMFPAFLINVITGVLQTAIVSGVAALWTSLLNAESQFRFTTLVTNAGGIVCNEYVFRRGPG
jgi:peptidoglycan biosynthesis protein MviN/MurJ (putative lipid II flippase)